MREGPVALVTGASRGIGRAIAVGLAADGASVVGVHYASAAKEAERTASQVAGLGALPVLVELDLAHNAAEAAVAITEQFLDAVQQHTGVRGADVLVNNAGVIEAQELGQCTMESVSRTLMANTAAPLFLIQALSPYLREGGRIINVSSGVTRVADTKYPAYAASKAALNALTLTLSPVFGARGITINAVMPGYVETDRLRERLQRPGARDAVNAMSVFNRVGTPDDIAQAVRYLASEGARWTTGQVIDVSGGTALTAAAVKGR